MDRQLRMIGGPTAEQILQAIRNHQRPAVTRGHRIGAALLHCQKKTTTGIAPSDGMNYLHTLEIHQPKIEDFRDE